MTSAPPPVQSPATPPATKKRTARILVVEDNPVMGQILGTLISRMGLAYKTAPNGREAIKAAGEAAYGLILMDVMMPEMDGIEATRAIREGGGPSAKAPIIAVTGHTESADIEACLKAGMNGHLKKPVGDFALRRAIAGFIEIGMEGPAAKEAGSVADALGADSRDDLNVLNWDAFREYGLLLKRKLPGLLKDYLVAAPDLLGGISEAIVVDDGERIAFLAHKLKSTSLVFGAESVSELAAKLEILGREGNIAGAQTLFYELHVQYERTQAVLRKKLVILRNMG